MLFAEDTNITLIFLVGEHNLSHDLNIDCSELFLQGDKESEQAENGVLIIFISKVQIQFDIQNHLTICNINLRSETGKNKINIIGPTVYTYNNLTGITLINSR